MIPPQATKVHEGVGPSARVEREVQLEPKMNHHTLASMHKEIGVHKQAGERQDEGAHGANVTERRRI